MSRAATSAEIHARADAEYSGLSMGQENIGPPPAARSWSAALLVVGAIGLIATVAGGFMVGQPYGLKHALAAYHIGVMAGLAICLGSLFWVMVFHLTGAGWSVTVRRQLENLMILTPIMAGMALVTLVVEMASGGQLFAWMSKEAQMSDPLLIHKKAYLEPVFFMVRAAVYAGAWSYLAWRLYRYSTEQDRTGDKWLSNRARFTSSWGMLVFALTVAFAAFDWLMSMDYRFFSTMWGVYFFAGAIYSAIPAAVLMIAWLKARGRLTGLVTEEHAHDLAKLMFGFTVFWAYIAFGQYFLIWYANIPEETQFFIVRKLGGWRTLSILLVVGHFVLPFYILLWLFVRRSWRLLAVMAAWALAMEVLDLYWIVRPFVYGDQIGPYLRDLTAGRTPTTDPIRIGLVWLDIAGVVGALGVLFGLYFRRMAAGPLVPVNDPRLAEALHHRNYV
jgi:hypothetical protein